MAMAAFKDQHGRWRWRTRASNPFTGHKERLSGSAPKALNTRRAAEEDERAAVADFVMDPALRRRPKDSNLTLAQYVDQHYRPWMIMEGKARSTVATRESHLSTHILPAFGEHRLHQVGKQEIKAWVNELRVGKKLSCSRGGERRAVRTAVTVKNTLHSVFVRAVDDDCLAVVPPFPKMPKIPKTDPDFLEYDEETKLYSVALTPEDLALFMVGIRCGLRASEQKALRWADISFDRRTLKVAKAYVKGEFKDPKGWAQRTLDLDDETLSALQRIRHLRPIVFSHLDGALFSYQHLEKRLHEALAAAGVRRVRWHDLRHTFGSHLAIAGVPLLRIRDLMGHKSIQTTEIYAHLQREDGREAISKSSASRLKAAQK